MFRGICSVCGEPITYITLDGKRPDRWIHDAGRVWPDSHGHDPRPFNVTSV